jgi:hypothetical protein
MSALIAVTSLFLLVATLAVFGGVVLAPFIFGLFALALVGVLGQVPDRSVRQHNPDLDPTGWREGSRSPSTSRQSPRTPSTARSTPRAAMTAPPARDTARRTRSRAKRRA